MKRTSIISLVLLALYGGSFGVGQEELSKKTVQPLHVEGWGLMDIMRQVSEQTHLTVGIELDVDIPKAGYMKLDFPGGTVSDLATQCAALMHGALWKIAGNRSLLVYVPGKATSLSEQWIQYAGAKAATRRQIWKDLSDLPEIEDWLRKQACIRQEIMMGNYWLGDAAAISVPAGTITLGDMLELVSNQSTRHFWSIVNDTQGGGCTVSLAI